MLEAVEPEMSDSIKFEGNSMKKNSDGRVMKLNYCHWKAWKNKPKDLTMVEIVEKKPDEEIQHQMPIRSMSVMELTPLAKKTNLRKKSFNKTHGFIIAHKIRSILFMIVLE